MVLKAKKAYNDGGCPQMQLLVVFDEGSHRPLGLVGFGGSICLEWLVCDARAGKSCEKSVSILARPAGIVAFRSGSGTGFA